MCLRVTSIFVKYLKTIRKKKRVCSLIFQLWLNTISSTSVCSHFDMESTSTVNFALCSSRHYTFTILCEPCFLGWHNTLPCVLILTLTTQCNTTNFIYKKICYLLIKTKFGTFSTTFFPTNILLFLVF